MMDILAAYRMNHNATVNNQRWNAITDNKGILFTPIRGIQLSWSWEPLTLLSLKPHPNMPHLLKKIWCNHHN